MIAFLDSSTVLRIVLDEPGKLRDYRKIDRAVASELVATECHRTLDRLRLRSALDEDELAVRLRALHLALRRIEFVMLGSGVLSRAAAPFPTSLGTLGAIHLASALLFREAQKLEPVFVTHDEELARGATASGFNVLGI